MPEHRAGSPVYSHGDICSSMSSCPITYLTHRSRRRSSRSGRWRLACAEVRGRLFDLVPGELQPELGGLVDGLEEELVAVRPLLGPSSGARAARRCAGSARSRSRPHPGGSADSSASPPLRRSPRREHTSRRERPFLRRRRASGSTRWRRSPCGSGRRRSTSSSARSRCSARARRCGSRSPRTGSARRSSTGRPAPARRRWRASSPRRPVPPSRSSRRSRRRSPTSRVLARARERLGGWGSARSSSSTRSTASTRHSRTRCCRRSRRGC